MKTNKAYFPYSEMTDEKLESLNLVMPSQAFLNAPLRVSKDLATCKPAIWDVPKSYCDKYCLKYKTDKQNEGALKVLRKLPSGSPSKKTLNVTINGVTTIWEYGKKGDYWLNGKALMETLETLANNGHNKISIQ